jgi:selenocysteine-specific elongation factor
VIVGTAGHIDHGKTTLVRALTGVDTDRLKEEKERGISIELGYAYVPSESGEILGFIDVPGHERLVHTMVAGACGIDAVLLVVAADDGVMPQTREHLAIVELLGITRGAVALTKIDRVDAQRRESARAEVTAALSATPLQGSPIFLVNATESADPGITALRCYLEELAAGGSRQDDGRLFRLAVDRVFTLAGHGTIAAGTVFSGVVREGDIVAVMPGGPNARVRSLHTQNRAAAVGRAGERCALNLAGIEKDSVKRGAWLATPGLMEPTLRLDARLRLLPGSHHRLTSWATVHVHVGTAHRVAHVVPLEPEVVHPPSSRVQLVFEAPICVQTGDRFILRNPQATATIGGGCVLDARPPARRRRTPERLRYLDAIEHFLDSGDLGPLLKESRYGIATSELTQLTGLPVARMTLPAGALQPDVAHQPYVIDAEHWAAMHHRAIATLDEFHTQFSEEPGPDIARLRRMAAPKLPAPLWDRLVKELLAEGRLRRTGAWLHRPEHTATLSPADLTLIGKLKPLIAAGRFDPPWVRALAAAIHEPEGSVRRVLCKQVSRAEIFQVVKDLFYSAECIAELANIAERLALTNALDAAHYRDTIGLGRKRTIQILEFFDRVGYTRRVGDLHVLRPDSGWSIAWKAHAPGGAAGLQTQEGAPDASW